MQIACFSLFFASPSLRRELAVTSALASTLPLLHSLPLLHWELLQSWEVIKDSWRGKKIKK